MTASFLAFFLSVALSFPTFAHEGGETEMEVGADRGVTEVTKDKSFRLSPEAMRNFDVKTVPYAVGPLSLPKEAVVHTLKKSQIYRLRDGLLKPVDFTAITKGDRAWTVRSSDLREKDEIVVSGVGFLRIISAQLGENREVDHDHDRNEGDHHD